MNIKKLITPKDPEFFTAVHSTYNGSEFLQTTFPDPESVEFYKWIATTGVVDAPEIFARFFPQVPPSTLRLTSCGGPSEHSHLLTGINDLERLMQLWELYGDKPFEEIDGVLDFGVGCGRVLKWFALNLDESRCHGMDVREACTNWLNENYPGRYSHGSPHPPLDYPDNHFDLVYSLSVFSHLNYASNRAWLTELTRVCRPGGRIILSTHGTFALFVIANSEQHQIELRMPPDQTKALFKEMAEKNFAYHRISAEAVESLQGPEEDYGQTFMNEVFAKEEWGAEVDVLGVIPALQNLFQDFFILQPKSK